MNTYQINRPEVNKKFRSNKLRESSVVSDEELQRMFLLGEDEVVIGHAEANKIEHEGPNYFLIGGPYPNYS